MAIKFFLLGRPGSGKSTAARYIYAIAQQSGWSTIHINDYTFLRQMFEADTQHQQFQPSQEDGFDVIDFSVLDLVLQDVEKQASEYTYCPQKLLLLEFARKDYVMALRQFQPAFLRDAYFLFFETDINTCIKRVYNRSFHRIFSDDHFISEQMIRSYYNEENTGNLYYDQLNSYGIDLRRIRSIQNTGNREMLRRQLKEIIQPIIEQHGQNSQEAYTLPDIFPGACCTQAYCTVTHSETRCSFAIPALATQPDLTKI